MRILFACLVLSFLSFQNTAEAQTFRVLNHNSKVSQGEVIIAKVRDDLKDKNLKLYVFNELYPINKNGVAFIGVNVEQQPGRYLINLVQAAEDGTDPVQYDFNYSYVEVLERRLGTPWYVGPVRRPGKAVQEQRNKEVALMHEAYSHADPDEYFAEGKFIYPLATVEITDEFGTSRLYGTYSRRTKKVKIEKKVPHGGVDLRAKKPTPIMAINSGRVLLTHYFPLRGTEGKLLVIDHGSGIISLYLHLSQFKVKTGEKVTKGQIVAMTGATPQGTPPHLHLMVKINGVNVDPLAFVNIMNQDLER